MRKTTIKVAELATIFYAILVLMSLIIDSIYYAQFNIRIVSYMSVTEILLSCVEWFRLYIPALLGACFFIFSCVVLGIDPKTRLRKNPLTWIKNISLQDPQRFAYRFRFYFGKCQSAHAMYSIVENYNKLILSLPFVVVCMALVPYGNIIFNYESGKIALLISALVYVGIIIVFGNDWVDIQEEYDWARHPQWEKLYEDVPARKKIANHRFSPTEKKIIKSYYKYRHISVFAVFFISMFASLCLAMLFTAKDIKERGNDKCVVIQSGNIVYDTRLSKYDYIGESARFVFIFDRTIKGTHVFERSSLSSYLFVPKTSHLDENATIVINDTCKYASFIKKGIVNQMIKDDELAICDYTIDCQETHYQLVEHNLNHYIWRDSVNGTYLEQITLPKSMFNHIPVDNEIFNLNDFMKDNDRSITNNYNSFEYTYYGKQGENIKTLVRDGKYYNAWLFFDPSGQYLLIGDIILKSIKPQKLLKRVFCYENMMLISVGGLAFLAVLYALLEKKKSKKHKKKVNDKIITTGVIP